MAEEAGVKEDILNRFMKLEKPTGDPKSWAEELGVPWFSEYDIPKNPGAHFLVTYVYKQFTFYDIYDKWANKGVDFKIYPILNKEYWAVEVKDDKGK